MEFSQGSLLFLTRFSAFGGIIAVTPGAEIMLRGLDLLRRAPQRAVFARVLGSPKMGVSKEPSLAFIGDPDRI
jgi:hypothetical protein